MKCASVVLGVLLCAGSLQAALTDPIELSGSLSTGGGLAGTGAWGNGPTSLIWEVEQVGSFWRYTYTLSASEGAPSHMIIEVSDDVPGPAFTSVNLIESDTPGVVGTYNDAIGNSNPNMPAPIYGIKFEPFDGSLEVTVSFLSDRVPVWGSFYAKDGNAGKDGWNAIWNTGLEMGTDYDFIAVPDSTTIPAPGAVLLGSLGVGVVGWLRRRKMV